MSWTIYRGRSVLALPSTPPTAATPACGRPYTGTGIVSHQHLSREDSWFRPNPGPPGIPIPAPHTGPSHLGERLRGGGAATSLYYGYCDAESFRHAPGSMTVSTCAVAPRLWGSSRNFPVSPVPSDRRSDRRGRARSPERVRGLREGFAGGFFRQVAFRIPPVIRTAGCSYLGRGA